MNTATQLANLLAKFKKTELPALKAAAEGGDPESQFKLGALYANGRAVEQDSHKATEWLEKAARQGWTAAQTLLAWIYTKGNVTHDGPRAAQWYMAAAEAGDPDAMCALGDIYRSGIPGVERSVQAMLSWYQNAANYQQPKAQYMLGKLLAEGTLIPGNDEVAFQWLTLAILNGSDAAQRELAILTARLDEEQIDTFKKRMVDMPGQTH